MFEVEIYRKENGKSSVGEYIKNLENKSTNSKDARVKLRKVLAYIDHLKELGTRIGEPVTKHLDKEIWELRPLSDRIMYFCFHSNTFILLHHFAKKTQKTPSREIEQAKRNMIDYVRRNETNESSN